MSLFIGNLSARTRGEDIQRLFSKFGHCTFTRKERYGFVVYDFPQEAEKALRALRGRYICGEPLVLTWSKKQPIPFQGHQRDARTYKLHERHSARWRDFAGRRMSSNDCRDYRLDMKQPDTDGVKGDYVCNGRRGDVKVDNSKHHNLREGLPVDGLTNVTELVDTANHTDHEVEFDRYVPCRSHEGEDEHENRQMGYSGCDSVAQSPQKDGRIVKISGTTLNRHNDLKPQNACFSCGDLGHKIRDCPRKYSFGRKPTGFDHRKDDAIGKTSRREAELDRFGSMSWENLRLNKNTASGHRKRRSASASGKSQLLINNGISPVTVSKETDRTEMKDRGRKKRSRWEGKSPKRNSAKKARTVPSPPQSDYPASKSYAASQSSKSVSKSVSMRGRSLSSDSRSSSKSISSKSTSRSSSFSSSSKSLSWSSYKAHVDLQSPEKRQPIGGDALTVHTPGSDVAWCLSPGVSKEKIDPENSGLVVGGNQVKEPASEIHVNDCNGHSTCISSEEMCMVLKHYGMELPEESERHLPIEEYLGSARLWPWEIIYYRRLKKGLVSAKNYARRVSQNQQFGIVDKYVRSSSGWGEIGQDNV